MGTNYTQILKAFIVQYKINIEMGYANFMPISRFGEMFIPLIYSDSECDIMSWIDKAKIIINASAMKREISFFLFTYLSYIEEFLS